MSLWRRVIVERRRTFVPLAGVLVVNLVVLAAAVFPLRKIVSADESDALQVSGDLAVAVQRERQAQAAQASRVRASDDLQKFYSQVLPQDFSQAVDVLYMEIARISGETGLGAERRQFEPVKLKNSRLGEFRTEATLTGDYTSIRRFLYELETAQPFIVVEAVALAPSKQLRVDNGQLQVTVTIATYYLAGMAQP
jgi:hypothetical protein